jgi:hypothetical protein
MPEQADCGDLSYTVTRGKEKGVILTPHLHDDGTYVASMTKFEKDYVRVKTLAELCDLLKRGYRIRMSNQASEKHRGPSLISAESLGFA